MTELSEKKEPTTVPMWCVMCMYMLSSFTPDLIKWPEGEAAKVGNHPLTTQPVSTRC